MMTGIYVRVSTEEQVREGFSIRGQEEELRSYVSIRKGSSEDYLFSRIDGGQLSVAGLKTAIKRYNKKRNVDKASSHLYRHVFATDWIKNGGSINDLQDMLDHVAQTTTRGYVSGIITCKINNFSKFNFLEKYNNSDSAEHSAIQIQKYS